MRKIVVFLLIGLFVVAIFYFFSSFFKRQNAQSSKKQAVHLTYYRFGESPNTVLPLLQAYQKNRPNVKITVKDFYDLEQYEDVILNEMAEGRGPDIFSMPNYWIYKHQKKITPLPVESMSVDTFRQTFVDVADRDLVKPDHAISQKIGDQYALRIYGFPFFVDSLAVYYNKDHFEDRIPSRGRPSATWDSFMQDIFQLTKFESGVLQVAGAALGRADNIFSGLDIFYALLLQKKTSLYDPTGTKAVFSNVQKGPDGKNYSPAVEALDFFSSFSNISHKNFTWSSDYLDEITAFAEGKVSVIFGYSDSYGKVLSRIETLKAQKKFTIDPSSIRTAPFPQMFNPDTSSEKRVAMASYFFETVSRNSPFQREAWDLLLFLTKKENVAAYFSLTHRPSSRRDLLVEQQKDPLYGNFALQSPYSTSIPLYDGRSFHTVFAEMIQNAVNERQSVFSVLKDAEKKIQSFLPVYGFWLPGPYFVPVNK